MLCRLNELKNKYVINVRNGSRLGTVYDVEVDTASATVRALAIKGRWRFFGLLGREDDILIKWSDIEVIGEDTILVSRYIPPEEGEDTSESGRNGLFHILAED